MRMNSIMTVKELIDKLTVIESKHLNDEIYVSIPYDVDDGDGHFDTMYKDVPVFGIEFILGRVNIEYEKDE
jgi:hypothetical protein